MRKYRIAWLPGDGCGVDVLQAARIFLQNAINLGLRTIACPDVVAEEGDELKISNGIVLNLTSGKEFATLPFPKSRQAISDAGGLIPYTRQRLLQPVEISP